MSEASLLARLHDRPGALERAIGLIRRRAHGIHRVSVASAHGAVELVLRVDESRTPRERVRRDLLGLVDLIDVRDLDGETVSTRELLLAWIRSDAAPIANGAGRIVTVSGANSLLEATGTPGEIDTLLDRLDAADAVITSVRSGEVAAPMPRTRHASGFDEDRDELSANSHNSSSRAASGLTVDEFSTNSTPGSQTRNSEPENPELRS